MKKQLNDIRIRGRDEEDSNISVGSTLVMPRVKNVFSNLIRGRNYSQVDDEYQILDEEETRELVNPSRRRLLKIAMASGGIFIAGSILNKVSKINGLSLSSQPASVFKSLFPSYANTPRSDSLDQEDLNSFLENFRIVKNNKEYILYNKEGDDILIIDRDA